MQNSSQKCDKLNIVPPLAYAASPKGGDAQICVFCGFRVTLWEKLPGYEVDSAGEAGSFCRGN